MENSYIVHAKVVKFCEMESDVRNKRAVYRDLTVLCVGFLLCYTAYTGISSLQTALHPRHALGSSSLALLYVACVVSVLFVAAPLVTRYGPRLTLVFGAATLATYTLANFYPPSLYYAAVIAGLGLGPLWSAHGVQVALLARRHSEVTGQPHEGTVARFFGIFFAVHRCSFITGSLLSSLVLSAHFVAPNFGPSLNSTNSTNLSSTFSDTKNFTATIPLNEPNFGNISFENCPASISTNLAESDTSFGIATSNVATCRPTSQLCGSRFCHQIASTTNSNNTSVSGTMQERVLFATYGACAVLGVVALLFLSRMTSSPEVSCQNSLHLSLRQGLLETMRRMLMIKDVLLLPMAFFGGASYAFFVSDFSLAYAACALGIDQVGLVMASFGVTGALGSILFGNLVRWTGRMVIFSMGGLITAATLIGLHLWRATTESGAIYLYLYSALFGLANVVWSSQLLALVGFVFRDERNPAAAYACNTLWQMLGSCVWFAVGSALCLSYQIYLLAALLLLSLAGYGCLELLIRTERGRHLLLNSRTPPTYDVMASDISLLDADECHLDADDGQDDSSSSTESGQFPVGPEVERTSLNFYGANAILTFED